ncbi:MAG: hypothetical protein ACI9NN_001144, partial [Bacteroidia bacterium]
FGTEGGLLPEIIDRDRTDDVKELSVFVNDANGNGKMEDGDHILLYAEAADVWRYNITIKQFTHENNIYESYNYLYITTGQNTSKRVQNTSSSQGQSYEATIDYYHKLVHHELDEVNFLHSGREWFGESFNKQNVQTFTHSEPSLRTDLDGYFRQRFTGRSIQVNSSYNVKINNGTIHSATIYGVNGAYDKDFTSFPNTFQDSFRYTNSNISIQFTFNPNGADANAWLDFYELHLPVDFKLSGSNSIIYSDEASAYNIVRYTVQTNGMALWNVTDYFNPKNQGMYEEGGKQHFVQSTNKSIQKFTSVHSKDAATPEFVGKMANQNLHDLASVNYIMITNNAFKTQADRLASFHRDANNYSVAVVDVSQIYNEFSGGKKDVSAIRDFVRMVYSRGQNTSKPLQYVLLFGDGSFDYKNRVSNNTDFIPTFQSKNSYGPSASYASDDFFAILDETEGYFETNGRPEGLDIGVGRIPCKSLDLAGIAVDKIIRYQSSISLGDWRTRMSFLADDEDANRHFDDTEWVIRYVTAQKPVYNVNKIYLDAFVQQSFGSGEKYPEVNETIDRSFDRGHLIFNYLGHGGVSGMAHERVITRDQIRTWNNTNKLPLVITATCELSRYDDPSQDSPGELMIFNEKGGAIALITTTRIVYITLNSNLNDKVFDQNLLTNNPALGDIIMIAKNNSARDENQRNFTLLGDPGLRLAVPHYRATTTHINDSMAGNAVAIDTFKAFAKMKVDGVVRNPDQSIATNFNGSVYPTIYDKFVKFSTLGNDPESFIKTYEMQNSAIYRGKATVVDGKFSFQFVVPKDIAYQYGFGKISYYVENGQQDGFGHDNTIVVGGTTDSVDVDETGPELQLFMDDEKFVFGGTTGTTPLLLCKVYDLNGINTAGNGIGRDLIGILDEGTEAERTIVLNDYYQAKLNSYQSGEIRYDLSSLEKGRHTLRVRVWDVYNNATEDYTEFVVSDESDITVNHLLNYPNPFTTHTTFHFDHNKAGQQMDVLIQVMSTTGRVVKTLRYHSPSSSAHFDEISWDGKDDYGDAIGRGVYLYKLTVKTEDGNKNESVQKLVILK